ncbi:hypothetical protein ACJRO7_005568 [Eucalyptus globulus]|uniref:Protein PHLOEM PROTEIN 2-LIKE A1-like n=1 Tax=Eucalyptus globulus TaxID=34317 RepID=A0ABD3J2G3_EUCGL
MEAEAATDSNSIASDEETDRRPSLNTLALMRKATTPANISSIAIEDWRSVIYKGVLLKNNTQKFWVDEKLHKNCFLVLPKACDMDQRKKGSCLSIDQSKKGSCLSIDWSKKRSKKGSCLSWITENENCFRSVVDIHVIELKKLSWLLIEGRFKTRALSPYTKYEVAFVVKLGTDFEWQCPVELELGLPDGTKQTHTEDLKLKPKEEWINLCAGEFWMCPDTVGTIYFALHGTSDPRKSGLILRGVLIHPKEVKKFDAVEEEFL